MHPDVWLKPPNNKRNFNPQSKHITIEHYHFIRTWSYQGKYPYQDPEVSYDILKYIVSKLNQLQPNVSPAVLEYNSSGKRRILPMAIGGEPQSVENTVCNPNPNIKLKKEKKRKETPNVPTPASTDARGHEYGTTICIRPRGLPNLSNRVTPIS